MYSTWGSVINIIDQKGSIMSNTMDYQLVVWFLMLSNVFFQPDQHDASLQMYAFSMLCLLNRPRILANQKELIIAS